MKFGKALKVEERRNRNLRYIDFKLLKKHIKKLENALRGDGCSSRIGSSEAKTAGQEGGLCTAVLSCGVDWTGVLPSTRYRSTSGNSLLTDSDLFISLGSSNSNVATNSSSGTDQELNLIKQPCSIVLHAEKEEKKEKEEKEKEDVFSSSSSSSHLPSDRAECRISRFVGLYTQEFEALLRAELEGVDRSYQTNIYELQKNVAELKSVYASLQPQSMAWPEDLKQASNFEELLECLLNKVQRSNVSVGSPELLVGRPPESDDTTICSSDGSQIDSPLVRGTVAADANSLQRQKWHDGVIGQSPSHRLSESHMDKEVVLHGDHAIVPLSQASPILLPSSHLPCSLSSISSCGLSPSCPAARLNSFSLVTDAEPMDTSIAALYDFCKELCELLSRCKRLRRYVLYNTITVVKIIKKRQKHLTKALQGFGSVRNTATREAANVLSNERWYKTPVLAHILSEVEILSDDVLLAVTATPPSADRYSCSICLDIIVDPVSITACCHRFCWCCLVRASSNAETDGDLERCPYCRTAFSFNPESFVIDCGLSKFLSHHFPAASGECRDWHRKNKSMDRVLPPSGAVSRGAKLPKWRPASSSDLREHVRACDDKPLCRERKQHQWEGREMELSHLPNKVSPTMSCSEPLHRTLLSMQRNSLFADDNGAEETSNDHSDANVKQCGLADKQTFTIIVPPPLIPRGSPRTGMSSVCRELQIFSATPDDGKGLRLCIEQDIGSHVGHVKVESTGKDNAREEGFLLADLCWSSLAKKWQNDDAQRVAPSSYYMSIITAAASRLREISCSKGKSVSSTDKLRPVGERDMPSPLQSGRDKPLAAAIEKEGMDSHTVVWKNIRRSSSVPNSFRDSLSSADPKPRCKSLPTKSRKRLPASSSCCNPWQDSSIGAYSGEHGVPTSTPDQCLKTAVRPDATFGEQPMMWYDNLDQMSLSSMPSLSPTLPSLPMSPLISSPTTNSVSPVYSSLNESVFPGEPLLPFGLSLPPAVIGTNLPSVQTPSSFVSLSPVSSPGRSFVWSPSETSCR